MGVAVLIDEENCPQLQWTQMTCAIAFAPVIDKSDHAEK